MNSKKKNIWKKVANIILALPIFIIMKLPIITGLFLLIMPFGMWCNIIGVILIIWGIIRLFDNGDNFGDGMMMEVLSDVGWDVDASDWSWDGDSFDLDF